ncbi:MAG TPA: hypothetical protein VGM54_12350 [Chthoniobacter sp.]|jgi:hypothetical protein
MKTALKIAVMALVMSIASSRAADNKSSPLYPITIRSFGVRAGGCTFVDQNNRSFTVQGSPQLVMAVVTAAAQNLSIGVSGSYSPGSHSVIVDAIFWPADNLRAANYRKSKSH